jgi:hypothetical protein
VAFSGILGTGSLGDFELGATGAGGKALSGTIAGVSGTSGTLRQTIALGGTIAGVSDLTRADLMFGLSGSVVGTAGFAGALRRIPMLAGTIAGVSGSTANLGQAMALTGTIAGTSSLTATFVNHHNLYGQVTGASGSTAALSVAVGLVGTLGGISGLSGHMRITKALAGTLAGTSTFSLTPVAHTGVLAGSINGISTLSATTDYHVSVSVTLPGPSIASVDIQQPNEVLPGVQWQGNQPTVLPFIAQLFTHSGAFKFSLGKLLNRPVLKSSINGGFHPITLELDHSDRLANIAPGDIVTLQEQGALGATVYRGIVSDVPDTLDATPVHAVEIDPMVTQLGDTPFCLGGSSRNYATATDPTQMVRDAIDTVNQNGGSLLYDTVSLPPSGTTGIYLFDVNQSCLDVLTEAVQIAGPNFYFFVDEIGKVWFQQVDFGKINYRFAQGVDFSIRKRTAPISNLKNYVDVIGGVPVGATVPIRGTYNQAATSPYGMRALLPPLQYPNCTDRPTLQQIATSVGTQLNRRQVKIELTLPNYGRRINMAQPHGATCVYFEPTMKPFPESDMNDGIQKGVYMIQDVEIDGTLQRVTLGDIPLTASDLQYLTDTMAGRLAAATTTNNITTQIPGFVATSDASSLGSVLPNADFGVAGGGGSGGISIVPVTLGTFYSGTCFPGDTNSKHLQATTFVAPASQNVMVLMVGTLHGHASNSTENVFFRCGVKAVGAGSVVAVGNTQAIVCDGNPHNMTYITYALHAAGLTAGDIYEVALTQFADTLSLAASLATDNLEFVVLDMGSAGGGGGGDGTTGTPLGSYPSGTQLGQSSTDTELYIPAYYPSAPNGPAVAFNVYDKTTNPYQIDVAVNLSGLKSSNTTPGTYNIVGQLRKVSVGGALGGVVGETSLITVHVQPTAQDFSTTDTLSIPMPAAGEYQLGLYLRQIDPIGRFDTVSYNSSITITQH